MIPYKDDNPSRHFPFVNTLMILINILVFFYQILSADQSELFYRYAMIPNIFWSDIPANLYRLITSMFMHGGWLHIVGNMLFLWIFGDNVEDVFGHFSYFFFYLFAGISGAILQSILTPFSVIPMIGASGAISGVITAYVLFYPNAKIHTLIFVFIFFTSIRIPAFVFIGIWILEQILNGLVSLPGMAARGGTAYFAHIGGILFGFLMGVRKKKKIKARHLSFYE